MKKSYLLTLGISLSLLVVVLWTTEVITHHFFPSQTTLKNYTSYPLPETNLSIFLPTSTQVVKSNINNGEILYSWYLDDMTLNYWGYIQLWSVSKMDQFIDQAKNNSQARFLLYQKEPFSISGYSGYKINWKVLEATNKVITGIDYYLKVNNKLLRIDFATYNQKIPSQLFPLGLYKKIP
jgi:hypothetical protein